MYDITQPTVNDHSDMPLTTNSRHVAEMFGQSHKAVLNKIKKSIQADINVAQEFLPASYTLSGGVFRVTSFNLTRAGFEYFLCAMDSNSRKSIQITQKFLAAFKEAQEIPYC